MNCLRRSDRRHEIFPFPVAWSYLGEIVVAGWRATLQAEALATRTASRSLSAIDRATLQAMDPARLGPHNLRLGNTPIKGAASETEALLNAARKVCFPAGTLVSTGAGLKRIEELTTADEVWAFDHKRLVWRLRKVLQTFTHDHDGPVVTVEAGDEKIEATGGHPFWVVRGESLEDRPLPKLISAREPGGRQEGRWVLAKDLRVGDELLLRSGERMLVTAASSVDRQLFVYNLRFARVWV